PDAHVLHALLRMPANRAAPALSTLHLHDALPISGMLHAVMAVSSIARGRLLPRRAGREEPPERCRGHDPGQPAAARGGSGCQDQDRKSTRVNSSHLVISYAVVRLKKKERAREHLL